MRRWLDDEREVDEVVQDALFAVYRNIRRIDEKKKFSSYLLSIARNEVINRFRKRKFVLPIWESFVGMNQDHMYEKLFHQEVKEKIDGALKLLKEQERRIVEMYFFEDYSYMEIGERLKLPLGTVKTKLRRAKLSLKQHLIK